jgi:hypothetical protein
MSEIWLKVVPIVVIMDVLTIHWVWILVSWATKEMRWVTAVYLQLRLSILFEVQVWNEVNTVPQLPYWLVGLQFMIIILWAIIQAIAVDTHFRRVVQVVNINFFVKDMLLLLDLVSSPAKLTWLNTTCPQSKIYLRRHILGCYFLAIKILAIAIGALHWCED